ncbi:putative vacuolar iron transporter Ccc1 [Hortaea werneckii]|nr:putative vacuolar iron transporter Ccc1 [Hortaea werneckii]
MEQRGNSLLDWVTSPLTRTSKSIDEKHPAPWSKYQECNSSRSSTDVESQTSSDGSTLLDTPGEKKKSSKIDPRVISDAIIGLSDGLTVPFALTAGLSALGNTRVVIFAGLAELTAGAISMGLGGYLGAKSEQDSYKATLHETQNQITASSATAAESIREVFRPYELPQHLTDDLTFHLAKSPHLVQFLMHFQHAQPEQEASRAITCALTIACGYFLGGFVPLLPYFFVGREQVMVALWWSLGVMAASLFGFGYGKTCFVSGWKGSKNVWEGCKGGVQMMIVGGLAAGSAMGLVKLFDSLGGM